MADNEFAQDGGQALDLGEDFDSEVDDDEGEDDGEDDTPMQPAQATAPTQTAPKPKVSPPKQGGGDVKGEQVEN